MLRIHKEILKEFIPMKAKIILFGSVAKGNYRYDSDIDIAIISKRKLKKMAEKIADKVLLKYGKVVSLKFFDEDEFYRKIEERDPFVMEILKGKVIYDG